MQIHIHIYTHMYIYIHIYIYSCRICLQWSRPRFDPWVRKIPWIREWYPTPVFLPGESHGQGGQVGYSPWGCRVGHNWVTDTFTFLLISYICIYICMYVFYSLLTYTYTQIHTHTYIPSKTQSCKCHDRFRLLILKKINLLILKNEVTIEHLLYTRHCLRFLGFISD